MSEKLKDGWTRVAFGDVVRLSRERSSDPEEDGLERYVGLEHIEPGDLRIRRWGYVADGTTFTNVVRAGQVLFGKRRAYQRKVAVAEFDGVCSGDIYVLEPKNEHLLSELLPFICQTDGFFEHAVGTSAGSLSPRTDWKSLASYEFALPPLAEQTRIVEVSRAAESLIEASRNLRRALSAAEIGLLESLVLGVPDSALVPVGELLCEPPRNGVSPSASAVLVKSPERIQKISADIARHFQEKVVPNGFGAQVVTFDRDSCRLYKQALDEHLPPEVSDVVMTVNSGEDEYEPYRRERDEEEKLLDRFRDPADPLKILIVTSKLLTGFDAPILQTMYLDKPLRDHTLLQAICRTNRPYGETKTHGLIVDYLGVFDDVAQAIQFDEEGITRVVANISELKAALPEAMQRCLVYFPGVDRTLAGYEGLIAAQECLPDNDTRDRFAADYSYLSRLWEAISPDPVLGQYEADYRWLSQVYESVKPSSGTGRLLWHALGAKTIELIHEHVHVDTIRDDLETVVLDADLLEAVLGAPDPDKKAKEIEIRVSRWLRKRLHDPRFKPLGERLEDLKERHERGLLTSVEFLKELLNLARDVVSAERSQPPLDREEQGKAALTKLFEEARNRDTPIIVERVVADIDEIVRYVRFNGWQNTHAGEREVKMALRKTLFKYRLHQDQELFDRAYGYIRQYY